MISNDRGVSVVDAVARFNTSNAVLEATSPQSVVYHHVIHHFPPQTTSGSFPSPTLSAETPVIPSTSTLPTSKPRTAPRTRRLFDDVKNSKEQSEQSDSRQNQSQSPGKSSPPTSVVTSNGKTAETKKPPTMFQTFRTAVLNFSGPQPPLRNVSLQKVEIDFPTTKIHPDSHTASCYRPYPGPLTITNTPYPSSSHPPSPVDPHMLEEHSALNLRHILSLLAVPYFALLAVEVTISVVPVGVRILVIWLARSASAAKVAVFSAFIFIRRVLIDPVIRNRNFILILLVIVILRFSRMWERFSASANIENSETPEEIREKELKEKEKLDRRLNITDIDYSQHPVQRPLYLNIPKQDSRRNQLPVRAESERSYFVNGSWVSRLPSKNDDVPNPSSSSKSSEQPAKSNPRKQMVDLNAPSSSALTVSAPQTPDQHKANRIEIDSKRSKKPLPIIPDPDSAPTAKEETLVFVHQSSPEVTTIVIQDEKETAPGPLTPDGLSLFSHDTPITLTYQVPKPKPPKSKKSDLEVKTPNESHKSEEYLQALEKAGLIIPKTPPLAAEKFDATEEDETFAVSVRASTILTKKLSYSRVHNREESIEESLSPRMVEKKSSFKRKSLKLSQKKAKPSIRNEESSVDDINSPLLNSPMDGTKREMRFVNEPEGLSPQKASFEEFPPERTASPNPAQPISRQSTPPPFSAPTSRSTVETRWDLSNRKLAQFPPPNLPPPDFSQSLSGLGRVQHFKSSSNNDLISPMITVSSLTNITHLDLSGNLISRISENAIAGMPRLVTLNITGNGLEALPASLGSLTELRELYAGVNGIMTVPLELSRATNLEVLDLRANEIRFLHPTLFARMTKLQSLNLSSNPIRYLPPSIGLLKDSLRILLINHVELEESYAKIFAPYLLALRECTRQLEREMNIANGSVTPLPSERSKSFSRNKSRSQSRSRSEKVGSVSFDILRQAQNPSAANSPDTMLFDKKRHRLSVGSTEIIDVITERGREMFGDLQDTKAWAAQQFGKEGGGGESKLGRSLSTKRSFNNDSKTSFDTQATRTNSTIDTFGVAFTATQAPLQRILAYHRDMYDLDPRVQNAIKNSNRPMTRKPEEEDTQGIEVEDENLTEEEKIKKLEKLKKKQTPERRNAVAAEILATEQTYVRNLQNLVDMYVTPIQTGISEVGIPSQDASLLFSNVQSILKFHQEHLLPKLEAGFAIGAVFREFSIYLKMYSMYYNNFDVANQYVAQIEVLAGTADTITSSISQATTPTPPPSNDLATTTVQRNGKQTAKKFRNYMRKMKQDPRHTTQINLQSFLILPVQRLPRYKLLLDELLSTTPTTHSDYEDLKIAAEEVKKRVLECNEKKRAWEEREKGMGVLSKIKTRDVSAGIVERLRVVPEGRKFIREFVGRVVKVVEVRVGTVQSFGGIAQEHDTTNFELKRLYLEGTNGRMSEDSQMTLIGFDSPSESSVTVQRTPSKIRHNERNILFAANLKKDRYSSIPIGPLVETRFIGRKDEEEKAREVRLSQEAYKDTLIAVKDNRLILGDYPNVTFSPLMSSNSSIRSNKPGSINDSISTYSTALSNGDALSVYGVSRTSGRDFRFFLFSDLICWCKLKSENENEYELVRVISLSLRHLAPEVGKTDQEQYRWPAEVMEVYGSDDFNTASAGGFGRWTSNSKSSSTSSNGGTREAVARVSDDECVIYVRGEYSEVMNVVDAINSCVAI
ncbi:hypothetical protein HK098_001075 [Nowakowskiella sp. JEL0407]|nr:hypothetical protein HK098_001075 [Nowakowskiella sp. JEL0407]